MVVTFDVSQPDRGEVALTPCALKNVRAMLVTLAVFQRLMSEVNCELRPALSKVLLMFVTFDVSHALRSTVIEDPTLEYSPSQF